MSAFTVYGLRVKGEREARYIGQTNKRLACRLIQHQAKGFRGAFYDWLRANRGNIDIFPIAKVDTRKESLATEKVVIALCLRLGQRLFNVKQVPAHCREPEAELAA